MASFFILVAIIALVSVIFYRVMAGFLLPLFLAALQVVIFRPVHRWMLTRCNGRQTLAAALTTGAILLIVLTPLTWILVLAISEGIDLVTQFDESKIDSRVTALREQFKLAIPHRDQLDAIKTGLQDLNSFASGAAGWVSQGKSEQMASRLRRLIRQSDELDATLGEDLLSGSAERPGDRPPAGSSLRQRKRNEEARAELTTLRSTLDDLLKGLAPSDSPLAPEEQAWQQKSADALLAYGSFRQRLLGGPPWSWCVELANPDETQVGQWRGTAVEYLKHWLVSVTGTATARVGRTLLGLAIMTLGMYYFFKDGPAMLSAFMRLSPLDDKYEQELLSEFDTVSRAVVLASLLSAIAQGLLAGIGFFFAGLGSVFLLTMLTMVFALVPFIGSAAVWVPACLWLALIEQRVVAAIVLALYGAGIVSMADNFIKPWVLHGQSRLHPLLALLSVLGGVQALGPIGILVGPMVVSFLQALLNMLRTELTKLAKPSPPAADIR
jgi:predicted PurR-regulated permease PerM